MDAILVDDIEKLIPLLQSGWKSFLAPFSRPTRAALSGLRLREHLRIFERFRALQVGSLIIELKLGSNVWELNCDIAPIECLVSVHPFSANSSDIHLNRTKQWP
jgi:hypothetical protein